ncbi:thiosulfate sulfurtransferase [bacterium BMS3Abin12]|nr:thiosulfate sulfurtransferase [bacterium BMS3Abin12]
MSSLSHPLVMEPEELEARLDSQGLLVVDLSKPEVHARIHIPSAVHFDYGRIVAARRPIGGLLPDEAALGEVLGSTGITPETHVIAYDDEGGGKACRLLWTLDVLGHRKFSLLNGGLHAWANETHPVESGVTPPAPAHYPAKIATTGHADRNYILARLGDDSVRLLDARSPEEYRGFKRLAARGGHIPGAVNLEWTRAMDPNRNLRLRPEEELRAMLESLDVTPAHEVITYCQTHHRSAYTYIVLKALGFERIRGYPGSWSEWGNLDDTPVE